MILDSKSYRKEFEYSSLEKVLQERDRIIKFMKDFENDELPEKYYERDPSPETIYLLNIDYLKEICDLIKIKMQKKEDPKPKLAPFLAIEQVLSKLDDEKQKHFLEDLKIKDEQYIMNIRNGKKGKTSWMNNPCKFEIQTIPLNSFQNIIIKFYTWNTPLNFIHYKKQ